MAQHPDLVLLNGRIWTGHGEAESIALREGRVAAVGTREEVGQAFGSAQTVDLEGRRAIPGLIDSHTHFVRAGITWNEIVRWDDVKSLDEGIRRIALAAESRSPGTWIRVLGGWHPGGFPEGRGPTRRELDEAAPGRPTYVQLLYEEAVVNTAAIEAAGLEDLDDPGIERDGEGRPTGRIRGPGAFGHILRHFETPSEADQVASTRELAGDFNRLGVTGVVDPGGFNVGPESYRPLFSLWSSEELTLRVRLYLVPAERGRELEQCREWVRYIHPGFGDPMLRYVGMGEILSFGVHDMEGVRPFEVSEQARRELYEISLLLARHRWPVHLHAILDSSIGAALDVWERVDQEVGLPRSSFAHAEPIGIENLRRAARLGVGFGVQNRLMFRAADSAALWGEERALNSPPLRDILDHGVPLAAGTDATVVAPHDPWRCIWWLVTGKSVDGAPPRAERHRLSVEEALRAYTQGSAWLSLEEGIRGTLAPGSLADVAVLDRDPFSIDPDTLGEVRSELTIVGGRPVHTGPAFAGLG